MRCSPVSKWSFLAYARHRTKAPTSLCNMLCLLRGVEDEEKMLLQLTWTHHWWGRRRDEGIPCGCARGRKEK